MPMHRTNVVLDERTLEQVRRRPGQQSENIRIDLDRYYAAIERELIPLRGFFTRDEQFAIAGAMNSWASRTEPAETLVCGVSEGEKRYTVLAMQVQDSIDLEGLAENCGIDGPALVEKLQRLTPGQTLAIIDAVERWWADDERDGKPVL